MCRFTFTHWTEWFFLKNQNKKQKTKRTNSKTHLGQYLIFGRFVCECELYATYPTMTLFSRNTSPIHCMYSFSGPWERMWVGFLVAVVLGCVLYSLSSELISIPCSTFVNEWSIRHVAIIVKFSAVFTQNSRKILSQGNPHVYIFI